MKERIYTIADFIIENANLRREFAAMTAERDALVGAAYEAAAEACTKIINDYDVMKDDGKTYEPIKVQKAAKGMVSLARQDIRSLTPADATTALDNIRAQAKAETLPKMENCGRYLAEGNDGQWYYLNHAGTWKTCPDPILAAAEKEAQHDVAG